MPMLTGESSHLRTISVACLWIVCPEKIMHQWGQRLERRVFVCLSQKVKERREKEGCVEVAC